MNRQDGREKHEQAQGVGVKDLQKDNKTLPVAGKATRKLFLISLGIFFVYTVSVLTARILNYAVDAYIIIVALLSIVVVLEALFYLVAYLFADGEESQGFTQNGRFYILSMLAVMKRGIVVFSLFFMVVFICYGFNFSLFEFPWTVGIYIMLSYIGVFTLCMIVPGLYYVIRICVSARQSSLEWRSVQIVLVQVSVITITLVLAVLCKLFGQGGSGVILLTLILLLIDCLLIHYERHRLGKCFRRQEEHHYSKLYWVFLSLHVPAWLALVFLGLKNEGLINPFNGTALFIQSIFPFSLF